MRRNASDPKRRAFQDPFLRSVHQALARRGKPLRTRGEFEVHCSEPHSDAEWIEVALTRRGTTSTILQALPRNRVNLYLRSAKRADRGKVLVRLEAMTVVGNGGKIVDAFERTVIQARQSEDESAELLARIRSVWSEVTIEVL